MHSSSPYKLHECICETVRKSILSLVTDISFQNVNSHVRHICVTAFSENIWGKQTALVRDPHLTYLGIRRSEIVSLKI